MLSDLVAATAFRGSPDPGSNRAGRRYEQRLDPRPPAVPQWMAVETETGFEPACTVLQTAPWPLGHSVGWVAQCPRLDSNQRPPGSEPGALSTAPRGHEQRGRDSNPQRVPGESRATLPLRPPRHRRARSAIRTRTVRLLKTAPLPLGYPGLVPATYPRRDSNAQPAAPHTAASTVGPRGLVLRAEDSNLHRPFQRRVCCRLHQLARVPFRRRRIRTVPRPGLEPGLSRFVDGRSLR